MRYKPINSMQEVPCDDCVMKQRLYEAAREVVNEANGRCTGIDKQHKVYRAMAHLESVIDDLEAGTE